MLLNKLNSFAEKSALNIITESNYIELVNSLVRIRFSYDRGELFVRIINPKSSEEYDFHKVYKFITNRYIRTKNDKLGLEEQIDSDLQALSEIPKIINGDFTWAINYNLELVEEKKLLEFVWKLPSSDPIYLKFKNGDESWLEDIKKLLAKNH